jgi:hypothetical protein
MVESTGYTQGDVYYSSYANLGKLHALRTGISYRIRLGSWGNLNMNMFYRKSFYKDYPFSGDALGAQGNLFLSYKKLSLNMFANYIGTNYSKTDKSNYHTESETTLSWRCSKQFTVSAGLRYFMPGFKDYMWTKNGSFSSYNKYTVPHLMPMIGISLNFRSKANVGNRQKPQLYNTEEDMNIKVK